MSHYKPYPAYKDSGIEWIGKVPEHWVVKRIEHIAGTHRKSISANELNSIDVLHYSIPSVQEFGDGTIESGTTIDSNKLIVECEQVLISKLNPRKGTVVIADKDQRRTTVASTEFVPLIALPQKSTAKFIASLVASAPVKQLLESRVESVTRSHQRVAPEEILKAKIAVPSFHEQIQIAGAIDRETSRIDALIAKKTRFIELLQEKRQALITHAVTKGLDPNVKMKDSGVEWIGEVPEHWRVCHLGFVSNISTGGTPDRKNEDYWNGQIPWVKTGEIDYEVIGDAEEKITESGLINSSAAIVEAGAILMAMYGMGATRGRVAILGIAAAFNQACAAISCHTSAYNWYIFYCLVAAHRFVRDLGNAASQVNLSLEIISKLKVPVPSRQEQEQIIRRLSKRLERLQSLEQRVTQSLGLLKERRSAFITAAVTGQIDLREAA